MSKDVKQENNRLSSGQGTTEGYFVEARHNYTEPKVVAGQIFTREWKRVYFDDESPIGVPARCGYIEPLLKLGQCYSYEGAQALRWWLHAEASSDRQFSGLCFETRIVAVDIKYSYECVREGEYEHIGGDGNKISSHYPRKNEETTK